MVSTGWDEGAPVTIDIDGTQPLTPDSVQALTRFCDQAESSGTGPVTIRVSGAPARVRPDDLEISLVTRWERVVRRLEQVPVVTAALATGDCGGAALDVLLATDLRVATPNTRLIVSRDRDATWPGLSGYRLVQQAGVAGVRRALLFGRPIEAEAAMALGLLDDVGPDPVALLAAAERLADGLSGRETAIRRRLMLDAATTSFEEALGAHLAACDRSLRQSPGRPAPVTP
jgi:isomerase DpgB